MYQYFSAISPFLRDGDIKLATIWAEQTLEQFIPSPSAPSPTATVPVHPLFLRAYERYRNELGMQMREAIPQWSVYQAAFARASPFGRIKCRRISFLRYPMNDGQAEAT
jgi:hypothetical protein